MIINDHHDIYTTIIEASFIYIYLKNKQFLFLLIEMKLFILSIASKYIKID
jgi:hypothetical protein